MSDFENWNDEVAITKIFFLKPKPTTCSEVSSAWNKKLFSIPATVKVIPMDHATAHKWIPSFRESSCLHWRENCDKWKPLKQTEHSDSQ